MSNTKTAKDTRTKSAADILLPTQVGTPPNESVGEMQLDLDFAGKKNNQKKIKKPNIVMNIIHHALLSLSPLLLQFFDITLILINYD